jgi:hypothetical protein
MVGRLLIAGLLALSITACSDSAPAPTALPDSPALGITVIQNHNDTPVIVDDNPCLPEAVAFSGKVHTVAKLNDDGTIDVRTNFAGLKGVGLTSGVDYVLQQNSHGTVLDPNPLPFHQTVEFHTRVISKGGLPNHHLIVSRDITVIAAPDPLDPPIVTISNITIRSECRG